MIEREEADDRTSDRGVGLTKKYAVYKLVPCPDEHCASKHHYRKVKQQVFVLKPNTDPSARLALETYAKDARRRGYRALAIDLDNWLDRLGVEEARAVSAQAAQAIADRSIRSE